MSGKGLKWEKASAERRMKKYGAEDVHAGGYSLKRQHQGDGKAARRVLAFIQEVLPPVEEVVEARRHDPLPPSKEPRHDGETRADRDAWLSGILGAVED